ncbi:unnamed protein product [Polarella glacialis]|uniref:UMP/CMP kinase n=1 Tax=Polarella glacialis TaxID=89957 RepID=A0A813K0W7_POLGL|nr:unnamed protein product [Polarella glacialis]
MAAACQAQPSLWAVGLRSPVVASRYSAYRLLSPPKSSASEAPPFRTSRALGVAMAAFTLATRRRCRLVSSSSGGVLHQARCFGWSVPQSLARPGRALSTKTKAAAAAGEVNSDSCEGPLPFVLFVIGGPGSGKGTQCEYVAKELGFVHLSAGELLREERRREGSPLRELIEEVIRTGKTVPSEVIAELLEQAMRAAGGWRAGALAARFVVDGYPRSEEQLQGWQSIVSRKVNLLCCLSLEVGRDEMRRRLLGRAETSGRADDNAETIEKRFATFQAETGPLLKHFQSEGQLQVVDGGRDASLVFQDVRSSIIEAVEKAEKQA